MNSTQLSSTQMSGGFASVADFFAMGGHGFYVWLAYGAAFVVFLFLLLEPRWRQQQLRKRLQAFYRREQLDAQAAEQVQHERSDV
jgi:heme exporter protein D